MSFGRYNPRKRYLERGRKRNNALIAGIALFTTLAVISFWMGRQYASFQVNSLKKENQENTKQITQLQDEITKLRAAAQTATSRFDQLQTQYNEDLPDEGPMRQIVELVRKQISEGMSAERLAFVIRSTRPPRNCSDPASKRFMVKTPAYKGPESAAAFGEGAVVITANGASSVSKDGNPQSWFDPSQAVSVTFKTSDGQTEEKKSTLPIQHSLIAAGREYRFTLSEGEKSFMKVTYDSCDYP